MPGALRRAACRAALRCSGSSCWREQTLCVPHVVQRGNDSPMAGRVLWLVSQDLQDTQERSLLAADLAENALPRLPGGLKDSSETSQALRRSKRRSRNARVLSMACCSTSA